VRPVELAFQLIELIGERQPVGVAELARLAGVPKSTAQRTLVALTSTGWIESLGSAGWVLTVRAAVATGRPSPRHMAVRKLAIPVMDDLRRAVSETVHLFYRFENMTVLVERLDGAKPVRYLFPYASSAPLHSTSSGKAVLANLRSDELEAFLALPLAQLTSETVVDPDKLRGELNVVRERGYALTLGGHVPNVTGVGAAIIDRDGQPFAAMSVSAPSERLDPETIKRVGPLVADAARRVGLGA
jgi:IclR family acetate operon transcriptional repressor